MSECRNKLTTAKHARGKSSCMGQDKAVLKLEGLSMIERAVLQVSDLADDVFFVRNEPRWTHLG